MGERRGMYRVLLGKSEGKSPIGSPRYRWEDNFKMNLQEVGWRAWTALNWLRTDRWWALVSAVMNLRVP
jgi:hypothetical protein